VGHPVSEKSSKIVYMWTKVIFMFCLIFLRYLNDLYTLDLSQHDNLQWDVPCTYGQPPTPRESHSAVLHTAENGKHPRLFIYGGMSGCRLADVYILDVGECCILIVCWKIQYVFWGGGFFIQFCDQDLGIYNHSTTFFIKHSVLIKMIVMIYNLCKLKFLYFILKYIDEEKKVGRNYIKIQFVAIFRANSAGKNFGEPLQTFGQNLVPSKFYYIVIQKNYY